MLYKIIVRSIAMTYCLICGRSANARVNNQKPLTLPLILTVPLFTVPIGLFRIKSLSFRWF